MALPETKLQPRHADSIPELPAFETNQEVNLIELFYRLLENYAIIAAAAVLCALIAAAYSFFLATPKYQAAAKLYVVNSKDSALNFSDLQIGSYLTSDYQEVFKAWEVHEMVKQELDLDYSYRQLGKMLTIGNPSGTRILNITVTSDDPMEAADIANTYANVSKKYISQTMATNEPNVLSVALPPAVPISPNKTQNILIALLFGGFFAGGVITLQYVLDDKIKTADDIRRYANLATLAVIPIMDSALTGAKKIKKLKKAKYKET